MFTISEATDRQLEKWDAFVEASINGTVFHRRSFLSYHKDRFRPFEKWLVVQKGGAPFGQLSLTMTDEDGSRVARSPYGASYGGFVLKAFPTYKESKEIALTFIDFLTRNGVNQCILTHPIECCMPYSLDTFYGALMGNGFTLKNRDISSVVVFEQGRAIEDQVSSNARNMARKAAKMGVVIREKAPIEDLWVTMEKTFQKHGKAPTHNLDDLSWLRSQFPDLIYADVAYVGTTPVAGIGYFVINRRVNSSFYLCQDVEFQHMQALSYLLLNGLNSAQMAGYRFFDLGTSTIHLVPRENIFRFKENYTPIGMFRETLGWHS